MKRARSTSHGCAAFATEIHAPESQVACSKRVSSRSNNTARTSSVITDHPTPAVRRRERDDIGPVRSHTLPSALSAPVPVSLSDGPDRDLSVTGGAYTPTKNH